MNQLLVWRTDHELLTFYFETSLLDVGASYVVGKALGIPRDVEKECGGLIEASMAVRRSAAIWGAWESAYR